MRLSDDARILAERPEKVIYLDGERVVKVFGPSKPASDVFNEALNISRVEASGIPVSGVLEVSQVEGGPHDGCWALANRYVPGSSLREHLLGDADEAERCLEQFVELQMRTHARVVPGLQRQKDKLRRMVSQTRGLLDATTRYELHLRLDGMRIEDRVCHGDFVPSNVICGSDGRLYLCDWAHVTAGLPELDAAMTYLLLSMDYPDLARRYIELYCARSDTARQVIDHWLPVVAAAELSRGRDEDREFLLGWSEVRGR